MKFKALALSLGFGLLSLTANAATLKVGDVNFKWLPSNGTYAVDIGFQPSQFRSIYSNGQKIEMRYYSAERNQGQELSKHNVRRLGEYDIQNSRSAKASFTLSKREICPQKGHYVAKIWLDVKNADGSNREEYDKPEYQGSYAKYFAYTCYDERAEEVTFERGHFPEYKVSGDRRQLNFTGWIDEQIWSRVTSRGDEAGFELKFFAFHDGQRLPLYETKNYKPNNRKMAYTISAEELCGKIKEWYESEADAEIGVELRAIHSDGTESWSFTPHVTDSKDRFQVSCI